MSQERVSKYQCGSTKKKPTQSLASGQGAFRGSDPTQTGMEAQDDSRSFSGVLTHNLGSYENHLETL